jgi:ABC-2 type transport system permease protein
MTSYPLWRLEWLRLIRTRRAAALLAVYVFFGFLGPVTARYLGDILDRFGGDITVIVPEPTPIDGIAQFAANAQQIGLLVVVAVAAGALTVHALPEMAAFLRTRVSSTTSLILPRYVVSTAAAIAAAVIGTAVAWYETAVLIGGLPVAAMLLGLALAAVYLAFAVALVALFASRIGGVLGTVAATLLTLLTLPIIGLVGTAGRWLPSHLLGAQVDLLSGTGVAEYMPSLLITIALIPVLILLAIRWTGRQEL